jgi:hypothetical protein
MAIGMVTRVQVRKCKLEIDKLNIQRTRPADCTLISDELNFGFEKTHIGEKQPSGERRDSMVSEPF